MLIIYAKRNFTRGLDSKPLGMEVDWFMKYCIQHAYCDHPLIRQFSKYKGWQKLEQTDANLHSWLIEPLTKDPQITHQQGKKENFKNLIPTRKVQVELLKLLLITSIQSFSWIWKRGLGDDCLVESSLNKLPRLYRLMGFIQYLKRQKGNRQWNKHNFYWAT